MPPPVAGSRPARSSAEFRAGVGVARVGAPSVHRRSGGVPRGELPAASVLLDEDLVALLADRRQDRDDDGERGEREQRRRDRALDEDHRVAARQDHRPAQVLLEQRAEHEAEQQRRRLAAELDEHVADHAEDRDRVDVEGVAVDRVAAERGEDDDRGEQHPVGHGEQPHPEADQRQVQQHQHQVADPHRDDDAPEQLRLVGDDVGAGGDALDDEGADHQRHHRVRRDAEGQHRDERGLRGGVVGALGAGDALDGAAAEVLRVARELLLHRVGGEGGEHVAAAGQHAEDRAERGAAQDRAR